MEIGSIARSLAAVHRSSLATMHDAEVMEALRPKHQGSTTVPRRNGSSALFIPSGFCVEDMSMRLYHSHSLIILMTYILYSHANTWRL